MFNQPQNFTSILIPVPLTSFDNDPSAGLCLDDIGHFISPRPAQSFSSDILLAAGSVELGKTDE